MATFQEPYIGATDFTTRAQVEEAKPCINKASGRRLHVGAMMSRKTYLGLPTASGWEKIWLDEAGRKALFIEDQEVFNVLHFAAYGPDGPQTKLEHLLGATDSCGPGLHGLQLDMIWPDVELVQAFKEKRPDLSLILQVSHQAIDRVKHKEGGFVEVARRYKDFLSYLLVDFGMGRGIPFDPDSARVYLERLTEIYPEDHLAIGGGLGPTTYMNLETLVARFPLLSWDAQGKMRTSGNALDPIEMPLVCTYLEKSSSLAANYWPHQ